MAKRTIGVALSLGLLLFLGAPARADFSAAAKNLSNTATTSTYPEVAHIPGTQNVFVIWLEESGNDDLLYFRRSTDGGTTWDSPYQLTLAGQIGGGTQNADTLSIAASGSFVHVVFQWRYDGTQDFEIVYMRSPDLGASQLNWEVFPLTDNDSDSVYPDVAAYGEYVHVAYQDFWPGNYEIIYKRIPNFGAGTPDQTRRLTFSSTTSSYACIAAGADGVNIAYEDTASGQRNLFLKHIAGNGAGAYQTSQLTFSSTAYNGHPDIAVGAGTYSDYVYIVYETTYPGNSDIMYKRLDNHGAAPFNAYTARLTYSTTDSMSNSISFDTVDNDINIAYQDYWPGNFDVMYRKLANGGGGGFTGQRVSWGTGDSFAPTVAAGGTSAYVVWSDSTPGNYEILFKKGS